MAACPGPAIKWALDGLPVGTLSGRATVRAALLTIFLKIFQKTYPAEPPGGRPVQADPGRAARRALSQTQISPPPVSSGTALCTASLSLPLLSLPFHNGTEMKILSLSKSVILWSFLGYFETEK